MSRASFSAALAAVALCVLAFSFTAPVDAATGVRVKIITTEGPIVVALDPQHAPKTVANFLHYVDTKFYNGGSFFRAVPGFVIQGGNRPHEKPTDPKIDLETPLSTGILNKDGAISMARTSDPNSATSEFFICDGDQPSLDGAPGAPGYAAFGHVVSGMDVVRKIARLPVQGEMLVNEVKIIKIVRVP
ncbi:MAG TPA: peptidylprolyl isomerase [Candidatus Acidoferrales bacterium]|nr:peptidylprolyl isomerase [Candidatus Acidoferrales bacterium]